MGYSMPEMAPAYLVRVCPAEKIEKGTDHMSDYQNSDTAKWDAQEVRKQTSSGQGPKPKKKRRLGWLGYLAGVIVASFLLAGIGWLAVNDVCALNKAPLTATIEVMEKVEEKHDLILKLTVTRQDGVVVLDGTNTVKIMDKKKKS